MKKGMEGKTVCHVRLQEQERVLCGLRKFLLVIYHFSKFLMKRSKPITKFTYYEKKINRGSKPDLPENWPEVLPLNY